MAKGLKIAHVQPDGTQVDQRIMNQIYEGAVGGIPAWVTGGVRTLKVQYRTAANVLVSNAYIISQKGSESFMCANAVGAVEGFTHLNAAVTTCLLVAGTDAANAAPSTAPSTCVITGYTPANVAFYASRISNKYVWDQAGNKFPYRHAATQVADGTFGNVVVH